MVVVLKGSYYSDENQVWFFTVQLLSYAGLNGIVNKHQTSKFTVER